MELSVIFNGQAHRLIAAPDDFFQNFGFLMPGDHILDSIEISNTTDKEAEIFFHVEGDNLDNEQKKILNEMEM